MNIEIKYGEIFKQNYNFKAFLLVCRVRYDPVRHSNLWTII